MPLFLCYALLPVPPQRLTFWAMQQVLNKQPCHPYICSFHVWLCMVRALKPVLIGRVKKVGLCCVPSFLPLKRQKHCYLQEPLQQLMPLFPYEVPLTSVRLKYKCVFQPSFWHPLPCHVLFQHGWAIAWLFIWMSSNIQLRKDLDATYCFFALCLFLCHVLLREVL